LNCTNGRPVARPAEASAVVVVLELVVLLLDGGIVLVLDGCVVLGGGVVAGIDLVAGVDVVGWRSFAFAQAAPTLSASASAPVAAASLLSLFMRCLLCCGIGCDGGVRHAVPMMRNGD